jgi:serine/threonine protein kinase
MALLPTRYVPDGAPMAGGMGAVQICMDSILERKVAIKFIHGSTHRRRILDELSALLKMRSKHVVQVYDVLRIGGDDLGIVQEFIDGKDLFESHSIPVDEARYLKQLWQIASGISDIHEAGVIHRDIKPNNMKTDPEGLIKIFDFGLARDEGPSASTMGFVGTHGFAAPELYWGSVKFTPAVDTYAFGATALFLAMGRLPRSMVNPPYKPSARFDRLTLTLTDDIANVLNSCLAEAPSDRPSMKEVQRLLARRLLHDRHQALVVFNGAESRLNHGNRSIDLNLPTIGQIRITYNGLDFLVESASGEVQINNRAVVVGEAIPGSCVVSLGVWPRRANERKFITFDVSHPEMVL